MTLAHLDLDGNQPTVGLEAEVNPRSPGLVLDDGGSAPGLEPFGDPPGPPLVGDSAPPWPLETLTP
jgi:hypothetical protein